MQVNAIVTRLDGQETFVKVSSYPAGRCGRCNEQGGCRSGILSQLFGSACCEYQVIDVFSSPIGALVVVEVPDGIAVRAALMVYMLPLMLILSFASIAYGLTSSELYAAASMLLGVLVGWGAVYVLKSTGKLDSMRPRIVRRMTE